MLARWIERHAGLTAVLVLLIVAPVVAWATAQYIGGAFTMEGPVTVTTDIIVGDDLSATGDITGLGNTVLGNNATADNITLTGVFAQTGVATFSSTVGVTGVLTATGGVTGALTGNVTGNVTGNLTGNVTGNTASLFQAVTYKGNLPTTSSGEETGEFFKNTTGDSGWVADDNSWVQLWP
jgi:hypothetical protein